jgi:hypothetical protein
MWNIDLIQVQRFYEKQVTVSKVTYKGRRLKQEVEKVAMA